MILLPLMGEMDDDRGKERGSAGGCEGADWDSDEEETECLSLNCSEGSRKRPDNKSPLFLIFVLTIGSWQRMMNILIGLIH